MAEESEKDKPADVARHPTGWIPIIPQLAWFALALLAFTTFAYPAWKLLDQGSVTKVAIGVLQIELAKKAIAEVRNPEIAGIPKTSEDFEPIANRAKAIAEKIKGSYILWVDDKNPSQNVQERRAMESLGIHFDLASSTDESIQWLDRAHYDAVISNINRPSDPLNKTPCSSDPLVFGAGCVMAKKMHDYYGDQMPPVIFYSARYPQSAGSPPFSFGVTNRLDRLFDLVFDALERRKVDEAGQ